METMDNISSPINKTLMGASSVLMILCILRKRRSYGYEIAKFISEASDGRIDWQAGSLYPLLSRMEQQGLIQSEMVVEDNNRPRKYLSILDKGHDKIEELKGEWKMVLSILDELNDDAKLKL